MAEPSPDFRKMTPQELREGMTTLNKIIKELRAYDRTRDMRYLARATVGTVTTPVGATVFPPAVILMATTSSIMKLDEGVAWMIGRDALIAAEDLRKKFKAVWRARPGRSFHDVAARREKEKQRKKQNRKGFPFIP